jgi:phage baseplate assembly protein W
MNQGFLGNGWGYDLEGAGVGLDGHGRIAEAGGEDSIRRSIWLILGTAPGERVGRPDFGCGIYDLVFSSQNAATTGGIVSAVKGALSRWEPRINVLDVGVKPHPDAPNGLLVEIQYEVQATNSRFNLVYPFYLST